MRRAWSRKMVWYRYSLDIPELDSILSNGRLRETDNIIQGEVAEDALDCHTNLDSAINEQNRLHMGNRILFSYNSSTGLLFTNKFQYHSDWRSVYPDVISGVYGGMVGRDIVNYHIAYRTWESKPILWVKRLISGFIRSMLSAGGRFRGDVQGMIDNVTVSWSSEGGSNTDLVKGE
jgi:hypothetical protein